MEEKRTKAAGTIRSFFGKGGMEREKGLAIGAPEAFFKVYAGKAELCGAPGFVFQEECGTMKKMRKDACLAG